MVGPVMPLLTELGNIFGCGFYKYVAPLELEKAPAVRLVGGSNRVRLSVQPTRLTE